METSRKQWAFGIFLFIMLLFAGLFVLEIALLYAMVGLFVVPLLLAYLAVQLHKHLKWEEEREE